MCTENRRTTSVNKRKNKLKNRIAEVEAKEQMIAEREAEVRVALRVPADIHQQICRRAKQERLSVNQAIVQAIEQFSGSACAETRQEIRDLVDICRVLGAELSPQFRRALAERVKAVYGLDVPVDCPDGDAPLGEEAEKAEFATEPH